MRQDPRTRELNEQFGGDRSNTPSMAMSVGTIQTDVTDETQLEPMRYAESVAYTIQSDNTTHQRDAHEDYQNGYGKHIVGASPMTAKDATNENDKLEKVRQDNFNNRMQKETLEDEVLKSKKKMRLLGAAAAFALVCAVVFLVLAFELS